MWQQMIQDLRKDGYTFQRIASDMGIGRSSVHDLWTGRSKTPSGDAALKLKNMHNNLLRRSAKK